MAQSGRQSRRYHQNSRSESSRADMHGQSGCVVHACHHVQDAGDYSWGTARFRELSAEQHNAAAAQSHCLACIPPSSLRLNSHAAPASLEVTDRTECEMS